jgi:hypothetical protein
MRHRPSKTVPCVVKGISLNSFFWKHFCPQLRHWPRFLRCSSSCFLVMTDPLDEKSIPIRSSMMIILSLLPVECVRIRIFDANHRAMQLVSNRSQSALGGLGRVVGTSTMSFSVLYQGRVEYVMDSLERWKNKKLSRPTSLYCGTGKYVESNLCEVRLYTEATTNESTRIPTTLAVRLEKYFDWRVVSNTTRDGEPWQEVEDAKDSIRYSEYRRKNCAHWELV